MHGNVRLWTLNGVMIGTFGQGRTLTTARSPWHLNDESTYSCLEPVSPLTEAELYEQEQHRLHYSSDYYYTYSTSDYYIYSALTCIRAGAARPTCMYVTFFR